MKRLCQLMVYSSVLVRLYYERDLHTWFNAAPPITTRPRRALGIPNTLLVAASERDHVHSSKGA